MTSLPLRRAQLAVTVMGPGLRPSQRLRAQGVIALTAQLVRAAQAGDLTGIEPVLAERHRLVSALRAAVAASAPEAAAARCVEVSCVEAVAEAVAESDRAWSALRNAGPAGN